MINVSIIVPVYNGEKTIRDCIQNLRAQTLKNIEIICIDDGSNDNTRIILEKLREKDNRIKIYSQKNKGAGNARNTGLEKATGEYVAFLDADDKYASLDVLEILYYKAKQMNAEICGGKLIGEVSRMTEDIVKKFFQHEGWVQFSDYQYDFGFYCYIYKHELLKSFDIRFPDYRVYEDPVFLLKALNAAKRFYEIPNAVYHYTGPHQVKLNPQKTIDYIMGITETLRLSADWKLDKLHLIAYERLITTANFYAEVNFLESDERLFKKIMEANLAVNYKLIGEDEAYALIPMLRLIWKNSKRYQYLRNNKLVSFVLRVCGM